MGALSRAAWFAVEAARRRPTRRLAAEMALAEGLDAAALRDVQNRRLAALCARVAASVPHYRDVFRAAGLAGADVRDVESLRALPVLDKATIREAGERLRDPRAGPFRRSATGGSTGEPLPVLETPFRQAVACAARLRSRAWFGIDAGDAEVVLFGGAAERSVAGALRRCKDRLVGSITYSAFAMTPEHLDAVAARIRRVRPRHLFGYSSALVAFARHLRARSGLGDAGADLGMEVVFTTSEVLLPADRALLRETFGARVADGYGSREAGFIAHECPQGRMHVRADTHVVEIVRDGRPAAALDEGELVVTHLLDPHWPLLRYRTGDAGTWVPDACPCGLALPAIRVTGGRITDLLVRADGALVHGLGAIYPIRETPGVLRFQVCQPTRSAIDVLLEVGPGYPEDGDMRIAAHLAEVLGGARVAVRHVDAIEQSASGKYRVVRSDVAPTFL